MVTSRRWAKTRQELQARMAQAHSGNATETAPKVVLQTTTGVRLASGALAGCVADIITFPLDIAKVRLQVQGESADSAKKSFSFARSKLQRKAFKYRGVFGTIFTILREEGFRGLYSGLVPGLQRQMCFCGVRLGLYDDIKQQYIRLLGLDGINVYTRIAAGITSGGLSVIIAQPTDVVKVRLQAQGMKSTKTKRYTGAYQAYKTIFKEEGIRRGLWKGAVPNITRNAVVTASELVSYDLIKEYILRNQLLPDEMPCHFVSAFGAGFITTCVASPVDVIKTRYMNAPLGQYTGAINCAVRMFREGGPMAFYKGFLPNFMRLGSWNIVMFVTFEQLKRAMMDFKNRDK